MVSVGKQQPQTYDDYLALPDDVKAELIDGEIYFMTAPKGRHQRVTTMLSGLLVVRFGLRSDATDDAPGGWWIYYDAEVHLKLDHRVVRPDISGWRRERMPVPPHDDHKFTVIPDWVCEVLSPKTSSHDTIRKMPRYLQAGVEWAWIVDPVAKRIDTFKAGDGEWLDAGSFEGPIAARIPPFDAVEIDLTPCWGEG